MIEIPNVKYCWTTFWKFKIFLAVKKNCIWHSIFMLVKTYFIFLIKLIIKEIREKSIPFKKIPYTFMCFSWLPYLYKCELFCFWLIGQILVMLYRKKNNVKTKSNQILYFWRLELHPWEFLSFFIPIKVTKYKYLLINGLPIQILTLFRVANI